MSHSSRYARSRPPPKVYSEPQLNFLKSYLPEYERRSLGPVRGDAKKFALERATDFIARFGIPEDSDPGEDGDRDARFRATLYNWYKNTVGRNRRKAEGRPRSARKAAEKATDLARWAQSTSSGTSAINGTYSNPDTSSSPTIGSFSHEEATPAVTPSPTVPARIPVQYSVPSTLANALQPSPSPPPPHIPPAHVTVTTLRDAFLSNVDAPLLASHIQTFVLSNPSPLALKPIIAALFQAISTEWDTKKTTPNSLLTRFLGAATYFTSAIRHSGVSGPIAGARALQMQIRKSAKWVSTPTLNPRSVSAAAPSSSSASTSSMSLELQRITVDRARRKDHIQWARIHAAALEVGVFTFGFELRNSGVDSTYDYAESRVFSTLVAQDALWEEDEVEWVAGALVLQALIRTSMRGNQRQRKLYEDLLVNYEERWKEMKDEARQALVTVGPAIFFAICMLIVVQDALLAAKADLARLSI
ncbi:hypothetical protein C8R45DRAFT_1210810 [Mycena sanguinolenta]|nr:hypothetical protein C8R45DRAFT_1210810 [Mycena sanguinolenta]